MVLNFKVIFISYFCLHVPPASKYGNLCTIKVPRFEHQMALFYRYLELVHPIWHRTHFNTRWLYISFGINWVFGVVFNAAYIVPTVKVCLSQTQCVYIIERCKTGTGYSPHEKIYFVQNIVHFFTDFLMWKLVFFLSHFPSVWVCG